MTSKNHKNFLASLVASSNQQETFQDEEVVDIINFHNNEKSLQIKRGRFTYKSNNIKFNEFLIDSISDWHKITVLNPNKNVSSREIIDELFHIVDGEYFVPIALRSSKITETFYVIKQGPALEKFFNAGLFITIRGQKLDIIIDFCVEKFERGMIEVPEKMRLAILQTFQKSPHPTILDLSFIRQHNQLSDLKLNLSNVKVLKEFLQELNKLAICNLTVKSIEKLVMSNNAIESLEPFRCISDEFSLTELDLQFNNINSVQEFVHLQSLRINKLYLIGNPIARLENIESILKSHLQSLRLTDVNNSQVLCLPKKIEEIIADNRDEEIEFLIRDAMLINSTKLDTDFKKNFRHRFRQDMWCRIHIEHNGKFSKNVILEEIIKTTNPFPFYPAYYQHGEKISSFFVIGHFDALNMLIQSNLKLKMSTSDVELMMHIKLNCAEFKLGQLSWPKKINYVIKKRIKGNELNLEKFVEDEDFHKIYITFTSRHLVAYIMRVANMLNENITSLVLRGNQLANIDDSLEYDFESIDLRDNQILSLSVFPPEKSERIKAISLDKNPMCYEYLNNPSKYLKDVQEVFPNLTLLDGRNIERDINQITYKNFLISPKLQQFIEYFIKFFFDLYDGENKERQLLCHSYDKQAIFTHRSESFVKSYLCGRENIGSYFKTLPLTQHDFSSTNIDVPFQTHHQIFIVINGSFEERDKRKIFKFSRSFMIEKTQEKFGVEAYNFVIKNDLLKTVSTYEKLENSLVISEKLRLNKISEIYKEVTTANDEIYRIFLLKRVTKLNQFWCRKLLTEANWDIKTSLDFFNALYDRHIFIETDFEL